MSAFLCTPKHIGTVARISIPNGNRAYVAEVLAKENIRSVGYRYPDCKGHEAEQFLGMFEEHYLEDCVKEATRRIPHEMDPGDVVKLLESYRYQACECFDWEKTEAYKLCLEIESRLPAEPNPNAPWSI